MKFRRIILAVLIVLVAIGGYLVYAAVTQSWDFSTTNYTLYKGDGTAEVGTDEAGNAEIYVDTGNGLVKLKVDTSTIKDDTVGEYNIGYDAGDTVDTYVSTASGPDASLVLAIESGTSYYSLGTFTSRVLDGGASNTWQRMGSSVTNRTLDVLGTEIDSGDTDLMVLWHMNEITSGATPDATANGYNATTGATLDTTNQKLGTGALSFNGANQNIDTPVWSGTYPIPNSGTIQAWFKLSSTGGMYPFFNEGWSYISLYTDTNQIRWRIADQSTGSIYAPVSLAAGRWYHIVMTWDISASVRKLYLDGIEIGSTFHDGAAQTYTGSTLKIGSGWNGAPYFPGLIDEVAVYNVALGADTILQHYVSGAAVKFQVRSGATDTPAEEFVGPDGTTSTYYAGVNESLVTDADGTVSFDTSERYAQYQATLNASSDASETPNVDWAALVGSAGSVFDNTLGDFDLGNDSNTAASPAGTDKSFVGLSKMANGGYNSFGTYTSQVFDAEASASWDSIAWTYGGEISASESGLVGLWHMNNDWTDAKGSNDGTAAGDATFSTSAKLGSHAGTFDGTGDYVTLDTLANGGLDLQVGTVEYWFKPSNAINGNSGRQIMVDLGSRLVVGFYPHGQGDNGELSGVFYTGSVFRTTGSGITSWSSNTWHQVAYTFDTNNDEHKIYIDGVLKNTATHTEAVVYVTSRLAAFGREEAGLDDYFNGSLDEVAIYNVVLSASEITAHYDSQKNLDLGGSIKFQARSDDDNSGWGDFIGSDGTSATFLEAFAGTDFHANVGDNRYFQYRAYLEEDNGNATPALESVTVTYNTSSTFADDTRAEFDSGAYTSNTQWQADEVKLVDPSLIEISTSETGLVSLWHMNNDWLDATANNNDGTAAGNATFSTSAKLGSHAGTFDGTGDYVSVADSDNWYFTGDFAIEAWINPDTLNGGIVAQSNNDADNYWRLDLDADGALRFYGQISAATAWSFSGGSGGTATGNWYHVAVVRTGDNWNLYRNGSSIASVTDTTAFNNLTSALHIGSRKRTSAEGFFNGLIDEVAIYNVALDAATIAAHYNPLSASTNTFISQTIDAGSVVNWTSMSWGEEAAGYGEALSAGSAGTEPSATTPGLVSLWRMNDNWDDSVGSNTGIGQGDATWAAGKFNSAGTFDGDGDYVDLGTQVILGSVTELTISAWIKPSSSGINQFIYSAGDDWDTHFNLTTANNVRFSLRNTATTRVTIDSSNTVSAGFWHHVAGVWDGSTMEIFINGDSGGTASFSGAVNESSAQKYIGISYNSLNYFTGLIDEVAIYNRALGAGEIRQQYLDQVGNYGLVGLWHLDETSVAGADGEVVDALGNNSGKAYGTYATIATDTSATDGKFGKAYSFDGDGDYVTIANEANFDTVLDGQNPFSVSWWHKANDLSVGSKNRVIWSKGLDPQFTSVYNVWSTGDIRFEIKDGSGTQALSVKTNDNAISIGVWEHWVYTYTGSGDVSGVSAYKNGISQTLTAVNNVLGANTQLNNDPLQIGTGIVGGWDFNGLIDEVAIYKRALSAEEAADHFRRGGANIKMQVSVDGGTNWRGADGTVGGYITTTPATLTNLTAQTIKYRAELSTTDYTITPKLQGVDLGQGSYPVNKPFVVPNTGQAYAGYLTNFTQSPSGTNEGQFKYQITNEDISGITQPWYYWNGSNWVSVGAELYGETAYGTYATTAADIATNIEQFYTDIGSGTFKFKAFLNSPTGSEKTELSAVNLTSSDMYSLSAPADITAGGDRAAYTVTRKDSFGNLQTTGAETVYLYTSSGGANAKFYDAATDGNVITSVVIADSASTANFWYYDELGGSFTITVSDATPSADGTTGVDDAADSITVNVAALDHYDISEPTSATAGADFSITVTAHDVYNNATTGSGTVTLSAETAEGVAGSGTLSSVTYGTLVIDTSSGAVTVTDLQYTKAESIKIKATDGTKTSTFSDITNTIVVGVAALDHYDVSEPASATAGSDFTITVTAHDAYSNVTIGNAVVTLSAETAEGVAGGGTLSSVTYAGLQIDTSSGAVTVTDLQYTKAEDIKIKAADGTKTSTFADIANTITVNSAGTASYTLSAPADILGGAEAAYAVTRYDSYSNLQTSGAETVYLYTDSGGSNAEFRAVSEGAGVTSITIADAQSAAVFYYYDDYPGAHTITASDNITAPDGAAGIADGTDSLGVYVTFTITSPDGGETLLKGAPYDITWSSTETVSSTNSGLYYSLTGATTPGDASWTAISTSVDGTAGTYTGWNAPTTDEATIRIKITDERSALDSYDISGANFATGSGVEVIAPNGGETLYVGSTGNTIQWKNSIDILSPVTLSYTVNGTDYTNIVAATTDYTVTNSYSLWDIGSSSEDYANYSEAAKVKAAKGATEDISDAVFTLSGIVITAPISAASISRGVGTTVQWKSAGAGSFVKLEYSTNGVSGPWTAIQETEGTVDDGIVANVLGDDSCTWNVPADMTLGTNTMLKITSQSDANLTDNSDAFTIADIEVSSPNDGTEVWQMGSTGNPITWTSAGAGATVKAYYSLDGGAYALDDGSVTNDGTYSGADGWVVPAEPTDNALIKITNDDGIISDESDNAFTIAGVEVDTPNGAENWTLTSSQEITWDKQNAGSTGTLYWTIDGTNYNSVTVPSGAGVNLAAGTPFTWYPGSESGIYPSASVRIKLVADDPANDANPPSPLTLPMQDISDAAFNLAGLKILSPAAGATWQLGDIDKSVSWYAAGTGVGTATVYYSENGFFSGEEVTLTSSATNDNSGYPYQSSYAWNPVSGGTPSTGAYIKVVSGSYNDTAGPFTLKGIKVGAPAAGATVTIGTAYTVTWSAAGLAGNVSIYYAADGVTYDGTPINGTPIDVTAGSTGFSWTADTQTPAATAKLKIEMVSGDDIGYSAESGTFTLKGIKVTAPVAAETLVLGGSKTVTWDAASAGSTVNIYYAADGSNYDSTAINGTAITIGDGSYAWTIAATTTPASATAKLKILSDTSIEGISGAFTMEGIKVTSPTATDIWMVNQDVTLSWSAAGTGTGITPGDDIYDLYYVINSTEFQIDLSPNTEVVTTGSYAWTVPAGAVDDNVIIRVKDKGTNAYIGSAAAIQIVATSTIAVTSPAGTDRWGVNTTDKTITWTKGGPMDNDFLVEYDDDINFTSPTTILNGAATYDTVYSTAWPSIPDATGNIYIRVTNNTVGDITDISDVGFKIVPVFAVVTPNGADTFYAQRPTEVSWTTVGTAGTVTLWYSTDAAHTTWTQWPAATTITDNGVGITPVTNTYTWTVPNVESTTVSFKVEWTGTSDAYDTSDADFTGAYYDINWNVRRIGAPPNYLDQLSVTDSSGWSDTGLTSPDDTVHSYPYGTYTTTWIRLDYYDEPYRNWTADADKTIEVEMSESTVAPEYQVLSNFAYDSVAVPEYFLINSWMERGGVILTEPTSCIVEIFNTVGTSVATLTLLATDTDSSDGVFFDAVAGVFWQKWEQAVAPNSIYFAKVTVNYAGTDYSSGLTYSVSVSTSGGIDETVQDIYASVGDALSATIGTINANVSDIEVSVGVGLSAKVDDIDADIAALDNVVDGYEASQATFRAATTTSLSNLTTNVGAILEDTGTTIPDYISSELSSQLTTQLGKGVQAEILTRPTTVKTGSTATIRFRTTTGLAAQMTITVYDAANNQRVTVTGGPDVAEIGTTGIYEYDLTLLGGWGTGDFTIIWQESTNAVDSMILTVSSTDLETVQSDLTSIDTKIDTIDTNLDTVLTNWGSYTATDIIGYIDTIETNLGTSSDTSADATVFGKIAAVKDKTDTIVWTDVTATGTNVATLISEVGTGNISAIRTATDTIDWTDVTGLVTEAGVIRAKTDTIDWANVSAIKTKTDTIDWTDVTGLVTEAGVIRAKTDTIDWANVSAIKTKTDTIDWTDVTAIRVKWTDKDADDLYNAANNAYTLIGTVRTELGTEGATTTAYADLQTLKGYVDTVESSLAVIDSNVDAIIVTLAAINTNISAVETKADEIIVDVANIELDTSDISVNLAPILTKLGAYTDTASSSTIFGKIAAARGDITSTEADIIAYIDTVETVLGTITDDSDDTTVFGKLDGIEDTLVTIGSDATNANTYALGAKTQASTAASTAAEIKALVAAGDSAAVYTAVQKLAADLKALQATVSSIPEAVNTDSITATIKTALADLNKMAAKEGYKGLVPAAEGIPVGGGANAADMQGIRNSITELKGLMAQVRSLLDRKVNAPVVRSWMEGR